MLNVVLELIEVHFKLKKLPSCVHLELPQFLPVLVGTLVGTSVEDLPSFIDTSLAHQIGNLFFVWLLAQHEQLGLILGFLLLI